MRNSGVDWDSGEVRIARWLALLLPWCGVQPPGCCHKGGFETTRPDEGPFAARREHALRGQRVQRRRQRHRLSEGPPPDRPQGAWALSKSHVSCELGQCWCLGEAIMYVLSGDSPTHDGDGWVTLDGGWVGAVQRRMWDIVDLVRAKPSGPFMAGASLYRQ